MIKVIVIFDSSIKKCEATCGLNWSSVETFSVLKHRIVERFGSSVELELTDIAGNDTGNFSIKERIKKEKLTLPVLLIDGIPRISGEFDARQMLDAIEVEMELTWKTHMISS
jgi:hypothetical protein